MNILWIEDKPTSNIASDLFSGLSTQVFDQYDPRKRRDFSTELPRLFQEHTIHALHICQSFNDWNTLFESEDWDFDIALIDINLETYPGDLPAGIQHTEFFQRAGFYIYFQMVKQSFPDDHIAFFTGNGDLLPEFEEYCHNIPIETPSHTFQKGSDDDAKVRTWLNQKEQDAYLTLRRGIIEGCRSIKTQLARLPEHEVADHLLFYKTTKTTKTTPIQVDQEPETYRQYVTEYLSKLQAFFPLHPPSQKQYLYHAFLKELAADWEISTGHFESKYRQQFSGGVERKFFALCQQQMKWLRNWSVHHLLPDDLTEKDLALCFMLAMRAWLRVAMQAIFPYEHLLAALFPPLEDAEFENTLNQKLNSCLKQSYYELRRKLLDIDQYVAVRGNEFQELVKCLGDMPKQKGEDLKRDIRQQWSRTLLYQQFWHGMFPCKLNLASPREDSKGVAMFINFPSAPMPANTFPFFLAKLIFNESF